MYKVNVPKKTLLFSLIISGLFTVNSVFAGLRVTTEMLVVAPTATTAGSISGNFGAARNSVDANQFLLVGDTGASIIVLARDSALVSASCTTNNPVQMAQLRGLTAGSFVSVAVSTAGVCTSVSVASGSVYQQPL